MKVYLYWKHVKRKKTTNFKQRMLIVIKIDHIKNIYNIKKKTENQLNNLRIYDLEKLNRDRTKSYTVSFYAASKIMGK